MCLNILREDWKPVLNLNAVIVGLQVRFTRRVDGVQSSYKIIQHFNQRATLAD